MEALPPDAAHIARRAAEAQSLPPSSESQGSRWDGSDTHVHNPWISIPVTVSQVHCFIPLCWRKWLHTDST